MQQEDSSVPIYKCEINRGILLVISVHQGAYVQTVGLESIPFSSERYKLTSGRGLCVPNCKFNFEAVVCTSP